MFYNLIYLFIRHTGSKICINYNITIFLCTSKGKRSMLCKKKQFSYFLFPFWLQIGGEGRYNKNLNKRKRECSKKTMWKYYNDDTRNCGVYYKDAKIFYKK